MQISVESTIKQFEKHLDQIQRRQLPFATSTSLNKIAIAAQDKIISEIPYIFHNTKKWYNKTQKTGIKVKFANKYELVSEVYTRAYFAPIQEEGGIKRPYRGNKIAVPTNRVPRITRKSNALRSFHANDQIFKNKAGTAIYRRIGKKNLELLYTLTPQAKVWVRFGFKMMAYRVFEKQFDEIFKVQLRYALNTAR